MLYTGCNISRILLFERKSMKQILQFLLTVVLCGCTSVIPVSTTPSATPKSTALLISAFTPPAITPTTTSTAVPAAPEIPTLSIPAFDGTLYPHPSAVISPENVAGVVELARCGNGIVNQVAWSPDGKQIAVASSIGISLYNPETLDPTRFFEIHRLGL